MSSETKRKYSFIIPIYNDTYQNLERCYISISSQIEKLRLNYEIIFVNDGSTNADTNRWCDKVKTLKTVKYVYQRNQGSAVARNKGLAMAEGTHVIFVDADDELSQHSLESLIITDNDIDFYDYMTISSHEEMRHHISSTSRNEIIKDILYYPGGADYQCGSIWGKVFSRAFIELNHIRFSDELRKAQDRAFMLECIDKANTIGFQTACLYVYYINNESITHKYNMKHLEYYYSLYKYILSFRSRTNYPEENYKFVGYHIFNEALPLTIFNVNNKETYLQKKKLFYKYEKKFDVDQALLILRSADFSSRKGRIKLFLFKHDFVLLLMFVYRYMQYELRG